MNWIRDYGMFILTLILVIATVFFSITENNRQEREFELRMRPYLTLEVKKLSEEAYQIDITNKGISPANMVQRKQIATVLSTGETFELPTDNLQYILGSDETFPNGMFLGDLKEQTTEFLFEISYVNAIEETSNNKKVYTSQIGFLHQPGKALERIPKSSMT